MEIISSSLSVAIAIAIAIAITIADIPAILVPWQFYSRPKHWQISHHRPKSHQCKPEKYYHYYYSSSSSSSSSSSYYSHFSRTRVLPFITSLLKNMFLLVERASSAIIAD